MDRKDGFAVAVNKMVKMRGGSGPSARSGHRAVANEDNMWVIGGYNPENASSPLFRELWRFNVSTAQWNMVKCGGSMPTELASHTGLVEGNFLLMFGGTGFPFGENSSNKLSACHLKTGMWTELKCHGTTPDEKYGQAMVLYGSNLIVYGGTSGFFYNTDLHKLNLRSRKWKKITPDNEWTEMPAERYRHEIALFNNSIFVLGGGTSTSVHTLRMLPAFCLLSNKWSDMTTKPDPSVSPGYPEPRRCHGCIQLEEEAYISGGFDGFRIHGDVWRINLKSMQWTKLADMPEPVYFHSAAVTPEGCMSIFGGVRSIEPSKRTNSCYRMWLKLPSLQTLCWQKLLNSFPALMRLPHQKLLQLGILKDFVNKLPCPEGA